MSCTGIDPFQVLFELFENVESFGSTLQAALQHRRLFLSGRQLLAMTFELLLIAY